MPPTMTDVRTATPWPRAREVARDLPRVLEPVPSSPGAAVERVLAQPVTARSDLPGFDTSSMDGWAVSGDGPWPVVGEVLAGSAPPTVAPGSAVVIATGAAVPESCDEIVRREAGQVQNGVLYAERVGSGHDIRPRGEECRAGDVLVAAGAVVTPAVAGLVAAAGVDEVLVVAQPRVHLLLLGDELLDAGIPTAGRVRDSLGPQLPGWVARLGGRVTGVTRVPDTVAALVAALEDSRDCDVVMTTGGTAAGPVDCLHRALAEVGAGLVVDSVAVRPGHPMMLADWDGLPVLGLPGNPQSAVVALMSLGEPLLSRMRGLGGSLLIPITLTAALAAPQTEHRLVLGRVDDGRFTAVSHLGSAMLRGLAAAQGFAVLPPGGAEAGALVDWLPLP